MRYIPRVASFLILVFTAAAPCMGAGTENGKQETLTKQWSQTVQALRSYTADQRDKALEAGKKTLDAMDERIDRLETWTSEHWDSMSTEARKKRMETLDEMRRQRNKVAEWYGGMKHSSAEAWDGVKQGFINSYDKLQSIYSNATKSSGAGEDEGSSD